MNVRILIAGLAGAVAMYAWSSIAHMLLPLGHVGVQSLTDDRAVAALQASVNDRHGLYMFPAYDLAAKDQNKAMADYEAKLKTMPQGIIVYKPAGTPSMEAKMFVGEFVIELAEALLAAWLLSMTAIAGLVGRTAFVGGVGLVAAITTNGPYWNWYAFPTDYSLAYGFTQWMGFVVAGVAIALVMGRKPAA